MEFKADPTRNISGEASELNQKFSCLLAALTRHAESLNFDPKKFSELYLDLLSCSSQIFKLEENAFWSEEACDFPTKFMSYALFSKQLAKLNDQCSARGITAFNSMLTFLQDWFSERSLRQSAKASHDWAVTQMEPVSSSQECA